MVATVFTANPALNADDVNNRTSFRVVCTLAAASNGSLQVTIQPGSTNDLTISNASIGKWSGSGANTTATPLELKFGGASGFTAATTAKLSDLLDHTVATNGANGFSLASGDKVVVIYDIVNQGTAHASQRYNGAATNADTFYKVPGTSWNSNSSTGFTQLTGYNFAVAKVETNSASTAYTLTAAQGAFSLSGQPASLRSARQLSAASASFALSGKAATLRYGYKLTASAGSFALSGVAANFKRTYALAASSGSFVLSGKNAGLAFGHKLQAATGSFSLSGQTAALRFGHNLVAGTGSFGLTGQSATLRVGRKITAGTGAFTLTGNSANLVYSPVGTSYTLTASAGSFALSGQSASLRIARKLVAASGSYGLTGQAAGLRAARKITAASGAFAVSGQAASLRAVRRLNALKGSFTLVGIDAALIKSGGVSYTLTAETGSFVLTGQPATLIYVPLPGIRNPLERLKMYTGSMGSVSNREDWIVNISLVGDDGTSFDLTGSDIVTYVCKEGCSNSPVLTASLGSGIVLTDNYTMQWHFSEEQMAALCPQQYDVFCRVERDDITTQLLAANVAIVEGGPA